jgi:hypothetical protein
MGLFNYNTKAANVGFGTVTTGAVAGTATQLPSQLCEEVVLSINSPTPLAIWVGGQASLPANTGSYIAIPPSQNPIVIKTGGNLNNIWIAPSTAAAANVGYQWVQYKPIT